jgi:hypothetical protein
MTIENRKRHQSLGTDQIPAELSKAGVEQFYSRSVKLLILIGIRRNCLWIGRSRTMYLSIIRAVKEIVVIIEANRSCQPVQDFMQRPAAKVNSIFRRNY